MVLWTKSPDEEVNQALRRLPNGSHVRLAGVGHELHGPTDQALRVLQAIAPFLEGVQVRHDSLIR